MKKLLVGAVLTVLSAAPLQAASVLDPYLGNPGDCYARKYDEAHLRDHPRQMVESFYLSHHDDWQDPAGELTLKFGFSTRNGRDYEGVAICNESRCGVEGDGGAFSVTARGDGVRLDVDTQLGLWAESAVDVIDLSETDDTVFLLYPESRKACQ